jgi:hypothetical protein
MHALSSSIVNQKPMVSDAQLRAEVVTCGKAALIPVSKTNVLGKRDDPILFDTSLHSDSLERNKVRTSWMELD